MILWSPCMYIVQFLCRFVSILICENYVTYPKMSRHDPLITPACMYNYCIQFLCCFDQSWFYAPPPSLCPLQVVQSGRAIAFFQDINFVRLFIHQPAYQFNYQNSVVLMNPMNPNCTSPAELIGKRTKWNVRSNSTDSVAAWITQNYYANVVNGPEFRMNNAQLVSSGGRWSTKERGGLWCPLHVLPMRSMYFQQELPVVCDTPTRTCKGVTCVSFPTLSQTDLDTTFKFTARVSVYCVCRKPDV